MSINAYIPSREEVATRMFGRTMDHLNRLARRPELLEEMGLEQKIANNARDWLALLGIPSRLLQTIPAHEKSRLEEAEKFFAEHSNEVAKIKEIVNQSFESEKRHLMTEMQEVIDRYKQIIAIGPEPVGEDKETGGFEEIYLEDLERALKRLPLLEGAFNQLGSITLEDLEGVITSKM